MNPVLTIAGPTPDPGAGAGAVREWCISTAAVDPATDSVLVNNEDGSLYRWNLGTDSLSQQIVLAPPFSEAYTPTVIAADGTVFAINNAILFAVGNPDSAPVAANDSYNALESTALSVPAALGVLANDQDADGDPLSAILVTQPAHGTLTFRADGSFTYIPGTGYLGADSFTYKASDGRLDSNVATVGIQILLSDLPPVAVADTYTTTTGRTLEVAAPGVLANDHDPDGGHLSADLSSLPRHGSVRLNLDGSFSYTPAPAFSGVDTFQYVASDGLSLGSAATVTIQVINPGGPPAVTAQPLFAEQGSALMNVVVGTILFSDSAQSHGGFRSTIDWGDGTASAAVIVAQSSTLWNITGSHVYDVTGTFTTSITAQANSGGAIDTSTATATVAPLAVALGGAFALPAAGPTTVSGVPISGGPSPTVVGTAPPGWEVEVVAPPRGIIGITTAGPDGRFALTTLPMPQGTFTFSLIADNPAALALGSQLVLRANLGALAIDATPPRIAAVRLVRGSGRIVITFLDAGAGLDVKRLLGTSGYAVWLSSRRGLLREAISSILDLGPGKKSGTRRVALVLGGERRLAPGRYVVAVDSSAIRDRAGLALDGEFRGRLPTGNGSPGGDFIAQINSNGRVTPLPQTPGRTKEAPRR
jgi:hypothetical protein